jgi:RND superfamily putative drug exporter
MIGAWLVVFAIVFGLATAFGTEAGGFTGGDTGVDVESQQGQNLIDQHFGKDDRANDLLVITSDTLTVDDPAFRAVAESAIGQLDAWQPDIASLANYYAMPADAPEASALVSESRHSLIVPVTFNEEPDAYSERGGEYEALFDGLSTDDVKIYELGDISGDHEISTILEEDLGKDMSVGMPVAGVVLLVVFGALIAAVLPLALALVTIGLASLVLTVIGGFMTVDGNANTLVIMIGLAVGVDYALFFLERFREERKHGAHKIDAIERAGATAGKAVIFSGITVVLAMLGLFVLPMPLFHGMGLGAASAVVIAVLAAVTLLPALLRLLGDFTNFPRFGTMRKLKRQDATGVAQFADTPTGKGVWGRMATRMMHRPGLTAVIAIAFLLLCTAPVATIEMGTQTNETLPPSSLRSAALVLDREFAAGENEPVRIVIEGEGERPRGPDR